MSRGNGCADCEWLGYTLDCYPNCDGTVDGHINAGCPIVMDCPNCQEETED